MLTVFWDSQRPMLELYVERGSRVKSAGCCEMVRDKLNSQQTESMIIGRCSVVA